MMQTAKLLRRQRLAAPGTKNKIRRGVLLVFRCAQALPHPSSQPPALSDGTAAPRAGVTALRAVSPGKGHDTAPGHSQGDDGTRPPRIEAATDVWFGTKLHRIEVTPGSWYGAMSRRIEAATGRARHFCMFL